MNDPRARPELVSGLSIYDLSHARKEILDDFIASKNAYNSGLRGPGGSFQTLPLEELGGGDGSDFAALD